MLALFALPLSAPPPSSITCPSKGNTLSGAPQRCVRGRRGCNHTLSFQWHEGDMDCLTSNVFLVPPKRSCHLCPSKPQPRAGILTTIRNCEWVGKGREMGSTVLDWYSIEFISLFKWQDPKPPLTLQSPQDMEISVCQILVDSALPWRSFVHSSSQSACITWTPLNVSLRINHWLGLFKLFKIQNFNASQNPLWLFPTILSCCLCQSCLVPDIVNE